MTRTVLHVDLDAFYASVEQRDDPALRGKPLVVGGDRRRGVVLTCSYEARAFGVRSAMPMAQATKLCPQAIVVAPRMSHYAAVSHAFFALLDEYSPLVEGLSLDEAFLDVSGEERLLGDGRSIALAIKRRVREELGIVVSVGVAACKFVAKVASDLGKPDGLLVVEAGHEARFLSPLPLGRLWGVGAATEAQLATLGLRTVGDVARAPVEMLARRVGAQGAERLQALARGEDDRPVVNDRTPVSVGSEETFAADVFDAAALEKPLLWHVDRACSRLRRSSLRARVVVVKVKYADHTLVTRRATLDRPTADGRVVGSVVLRLLAEVPGIAGRGVRLAGVSLTELAPKDGTGQLVLDERARERGETLGDTLDEIRARFGGAAVRRAVHLDDEE